MKWDCNFLLYLCCLWSDLQIGFQENDGNTLLTTVVMSDKAQMLRITAFPPAFVSLYICFKCNSTQGLKSQLHLLSLFICKYIQADSSMLSNF